MGMKKQNVGKRKKDYREYYDDESREWVASREGFLIRRFDYEF